MAHELAPGLLAVVAGCVVLWGLASARLERWNVTAPIAFVLLGLVTSHPPLSLIHLNLQSATIRELAEVTLALVLFADASRVNPVALRADASLPGRLLGIGLPLTIGAGTAAAAGLLGGSSLWVAAVIGAIVAPTDAALGAAVMGDERVPQRIRRVLNVESGLNDGIATPFVNLFLAGAVSEQAAHGAALGHPVKDLAVGLAVGLGVGIVGGGLLTVSRRAGWSDPAYRALVVGALALFAYGAALAASGNGFVAAFVAGMAYGAVAHRGGDLELEIAESGGVLMSLLVWFLFGAVMLVPGIEDAGWGDLAFAVLALTVVRMVPVALALLGAGLDRASVAFIGWFGPRGLASVVFGLLAADSLDPAESRRVLAAVTVTVALSVVAHGVSASPLARRYGLHMAALHPDRPEHKDAAPALPIRSLGRIARYVRPPEQPDGPSDGS